MLPPLPASLSSVYQYRTMNHAQKLFQSATARRIKLQMCDIGRRLWEREYVEGNAGNLSVRLTDQFVLCTPTLISKGFMKPTDMCLVDLNGNLVAGSQERTSEILLHLEMMKRQPRARAVVHCHSPFGTAYATAGCVPPTGIMPEAEVMLGPVAVAPYYRTATPELGQAVCRFVKDHHVILLANHGVVAWGKSLEDAYWRIEVLEAYGRVMLLIRQLGLRPRRLTAAQLKEILALKRAYGFVDPRFDTSPITGRSSGYKQRE